MKMKITLARAVGLLQSASFIVVDNSSLVHPTFACLESAVKEGESFMEVMVCDTLISFYAHLQYDPIEVVDSQIIFMGNDGLPYDFKILSLVKL